MNFLQNKNAIIHLSVINLSQYFYYNEDHFRLESCDLCTKPSHVILCVPFIAGYIKHLTANFPAGDDASLVHRQAICCGLSAKRERRQNI